MAEICRSLPGPKMANIVEGGLTPELSIDVLHEIGYSLAAYPLTLLAAAPAKKKRGRKKAGKKKATRKKTAARRKTTSKKSTSKKAADKAAATS